MIGIYMILNKVNNKVYIGQSKNITKRISRHRCDLRKNIHKNKYLQLDFNKYGIDSFLFISLTPCTVEQLNTLEQYYMICFESYLTEFGYNRQYGGDLGKPTLESLKSIIIANSNTSDVTREKLRNSSKGNTNCLGKPRSEFTKNMIRNSLQVHGDTRDYIRCVETGDTFRGVTSAGNSYKVNPQGISRCCRGKQRTCGGYHWEYILEGSDK